MNPIKKIFENSINREVESRLENVRKIAFHGGFKAASHNRLTASFHTQLLGINDILKMDLRTLRGRARNEALNNDYARGYIRLLKNNVVGQGVKFQNKAKDPNGKYDTVANAMIESAWYKWCERDFCTASGTMNLTESLHQWMGSIAIEGESIWRMIEGFDNEFGFAIQPIDVDLLDETLNTDSINGNHYIRMGVEFNEWDRPIAYYFKKRTDRYAQSISSKYEIIPADQIIHSFLPERVYQARGFVAFCSAMLKMNNINALEEAEIYAARVSASKMGFYIQDPENLSDTASSIPGRKDPVNKNDLLQEAEPGIFELLPPGIKDIKEWDPTHPNANMPAFLKWQIRSLATGCGIAYSSLANDLESVNFSSLKSGRADEKDNFKIMQMFMVESQIKRIQKKWLKMALLTQAIKLPYAKFEKYYQPQFFPRRWEWMDPNDEVSANIKAEKAGYKTKSEILADRGIDFVEHLDKLLWEKEEIEKRGLTFILDTSDGVKIAKKEDGNVKTENGNAPAESEA